MKHFIAPIALTALLSAAGASAGALSKHDANTDFLPVDQAFELQPLERRDGKLHVEWRIAKGYYLYRSRLKFALAAPASATLGEPQLPKGEKHEDDIFGATEVYRDALKADLPAKSASGPVKLTVVYQGCADAGLCYPPQTRTLELDH